MSSKMVANFHFHPIDESCQCATLLLLLLLVLSNRVGHHIAASEWLLASISFRSTTSFCNFIQDSMMPAQAQTFTHTFTRLESCYLLLLPLMCYSMC
jgi:glucan phosphoethanolaminetransferase (alkaline phosphatase superfamily)